MDDGVDRRRALSRIGALLLGGSVLPGMVGCGGGEGDDEGGGESGHAVPHPEDETVPEAEASGEALGGASRSSGALQPKDQVQYQHEPKGEEYCGSCSLYVPDQNGDDFGACTMVEGKIHPCDWCNLYVEHTGEGAVSCGQA